MLNCCYKDNKNIFSTIEIGPKREINPHFGPISTDGCPVPYSSGQRLIQLEGEGVTLAHDGGAARGWLLHG